MNIELSIELSQKLCLTQELKQSIEILQYDLAELVGFLQEKYLENPTLELEFKNSSKVYFESFATKESLNFENFVKEVPTLYDYLREQILIFKFQGEAERISELLLENLNADGYLKIDLRNFVEENNFDENCVESVLKKLKTLEPAGVFSSSLMECLLIQAEKLSFSSITKDIIKFDLEKVAKNKIGEIAKKYEISIEKTKDSIKSIKSLNPKPGNFIADSNLPTKFIIPDLILKIDENEKFSIDFNDDYYPKIYISEYYLNLLKQSQDDEVLKKYLKEKISSSRNIIYAVERRRDTILKVANSVCNIQREFILKGKDLKPLSLKDIAYEIDMHESTISRTVNGKYIETPVGIFELKDFFQKKIETLSGEISKAKVERLIVEIISSENKFRPYSDEQIVKILSKKDIKIARRTVAKYRDNLGIKSSSKRKAF